MKNIPGDLTTKATAELQQQVQEELQVPDPELKQIKAILNESEATNSENSEGDDEGRSHSSDQ